MVHFNREETRNVIQELWTLCAVLRDDGVTAQEYITELTYLLFLKMMYECGRESEIPVPCRWSDLTSAEDALLKYSDILQKLGKSKNSVINGIFAGARTSIRHASNLSKIISFVDEKSFFDGSEERMGDIYEGLLEKVATDRKSGAGQYFTPRPLVESIVRVLQPQAGEIIQDPAAGTGGFLVAAANFVRDAQGGLSSDVRSKFSGIELVAETYRLLLMNLMLHGIDSQNIHLGDTLTRDGEDLIKADVVLTNPPFGISRGGRRPDREDFTVTTQISNKQLAFVEHVVRSLQPGGRAAVIVPDNVLFAGGQAVEFRKWMLDQCFVHTILRLPSGIFYAAGVKTSVLFFSKIEKRSKGESIWIYDMRAGQPAFGRNRPLRSEDFKEFEICYGTDTDGRAERLEASSADGRYRSFSLDQIVARNFNLDITWIDEIDAGETAFNDPNDVVEALRGHLQRALAGVDELSIVLGSKHR